MQDLSDGGLAVALAEMAMAGGIGATVEASGPEHAFFFGEDQGRYVLTAAPAETAGIVEAASAAGVPVARIGVTGGDALKLGGAGAGRACGACAQAHETWLPDYHGPRGGTHDPLHHRQDQGRLRLSAARARRRHQRDRCGRVHDPA